MSTTKKRILAAIVIWAHILACGIAAHYQCGEMAFAFALCAALLFMAAPLLTEQ